MRRSHLWGVGGKDAPAGGRARPHLAALAAIAILLASGGGASASGLVGQASVGDLPDNLTVQPGVAAGGVVFRPGATVGVDIKRASDPDVPVVAGPELRQTFVVTNTGSGRATIELGAVRSPAGVALPSRWIDVGANVGVTTPYAAPAKSRLLLSVAAATVGGGRYTVPITVRVGDERYVYEFAVERRTRLPASGVFTARSDAAGVDTEILPFREKSAEIEFDVDGQEAGAQMRQPFIRAALRTVDGRALPARLGTLDGVIVCDGKATTARPPLVDVPRGQVCTGTVKTEVLWPGAYVVTVSGNGVGRDDGQSSADLTLNVRANLAWAIVLAALGAFVGSVVSRWKTQGRTKAMAQLAIAVENERVADMSRTAQALRYDAPTAGVAEALGVLWDKLENNPAMDVATPLGPLREHLDRIRRWTDLLDDIERAPAAQRPVLRADAKSLGLRIVNAAPPWQRLDQDLAKLDADILAASSTSGPPRTGPLGMVAGMIPRVAVVRRATRTMRRPARRIAEFVKRADILVDLLLALVVCTTAISTSWLANPVWGGYGDVLALVTATFTVQTGGAILARPTPGALP